MEILVLNGGCNMITELTNMAVEIERVDNKIFLALTMRGTLTHDDYIEMTSMVEQQLKQINQPTINALVDITELERWTVHAAWDDLKFGLKHQHQFQKIAIIGNQNWQQMLSKVSDWLVKGDVHYFENKQQASNWITAA